MNVRVSPQGASTSYHFYLSLEKLPASQIGWEERGQLRGAWREPPEALLPSCLRWIKELAQLLLWKAAFLDKDILRI